VIQPDIQYQLCRMEHQERVTRGIRHQEISRALAEARSDGGRSRAVARLGRAVVGAFTVQRQEPGRITRTETA